MPSQARSLHRSHMLASPRPCSDAQSCAGHAPPRRRSHAPLPPRLQEIVVHQRLRLRLRCSRSMMNSISAREATQAVSGIAGDGTCAVRGYRMGPGRGSGPDGRRRPRGCRQRSSETEASDVSAGELGHGAFAPRPRPSAVRAGSNHEPAQTAVSASPLPP